VEVWTNFNERSSGVAQPQGANHWVLPNGGSLERRSLCVRRSRVQIHAIGHQF